MGAKGWIAFAVIVVALLGGLVYYSSGERLNVNDYNTAEIIGANEDNGQIGDHVSGNKDAKVVMVEYGDYQCPGCAGIAPALKGIADRYSDDLAFVFRNLPLTAIHPNAKTAAAVVESAGLQGHFWETHDKLFADQNTWGTTPVADRINVLIGYASHADIDKDKLKEQIDSERVKKKLAFDKALADKDKVTGTPTIFINGKKVSSDITNDAANSKTEELEKLVRDALKNAGVDLLKYDKQK